MVNYNFNDFMNGMGYCIPSDPFQEPFFLAKRLFYYATIAYHVGLNAVLGLPHLGPTS